MGYLEVCYLIAKELEISFLFALLFATSLIPLWSDKYSVWFLSLELYGPRPWAISLNVPCALGRGECILLLMGRMFCMSVTFVNNVQIFYMLPDFSLPSFMSYWKKFGKISYNACGYVYFSYNFVSICSLHLKTRFWVYKDIMWYLPGRSTFSHYEMPSYFYWCFLF